MENTVSLETASSMIAYSPTADKILKLELGVDSKDWDTARKADLLLKIMKSKCDIAFNANTVKD
jgi:hypothetical protein